MLAKKKQKKKDVIDFHGMTAKALSGKRFVKTTDKPFLFKSIGSRNGFLHIHFLY